MSSKGQTFGNSAFNIIECCNVTFWSYFANIKIVSKIKAIRYIKHNIEIFKVKPVVYFILLYYKYSIFIQFIEVYEWTDKIILWNSKYQMRL